MATSANDILKRIKDEEIEWVDLRFTDPKGKWQHLTMVAGVVGEDELTDGFMFDGSSIEGWKAINESDMILKPDLDAVYVDPFSATPMLILVCDIVEPSTGELYARDPRSTAKRAEAYLKTTGIGDTDLYRPRSRILHVRQRPVRNELQPVVSTRSTISSCRPTPARDMTAAIWATARAPRAAISRSRRSTSAIDIRGEMVSTMLEMGLPCDKHHHEVAAAQHELGLTFGTLTVTADRMQIYKYVVHQVAHAYGKSATFMPKPIKEDNGSRHAHPSVDLERQGAAVRRQRLCRPVATCACISSAASSSTPSRSTPSPTRPPTATSGWCRATKRRCCSPIRRATARRRAAFRTAPGAKAKRVEVRFPDAMANPYLCYAALFMAGLDGIQNKHPPGRGDGQEPVRPAPGRTRRSADRLRVACAKRSTAWRPIMDYLLKGDVFSKDQIEAYIEIKRADVARFEMTPSPVEFDMYYNSTCITQPSGRSRDYRKGRLGRPFLLDPFRLLPSDGSRPVCNVFVIGG